MKTKKEAERRNGDIALASPVLAAVTIRNARSMQSYLRVFQKKRCNYQSSSVYPADCDQLLPILKVHIACNTYIIVGCVPR